MRSQSVLTLGLLFLLSFAVVWKVTDEYALPSETEGESDESAEGPKLTTRGATPTKSTGSKGQVDSNPILFPSEEKELDCEDTHTCSELDDCPSFSQKNTICGWNGAFPRVCCLEN